MNNPAATYSKAIAYSRGTTKVEALMNRISKVTDRMDTLDMTPEEAKIHIAHMKSGLRVATRAFADNNRMLDSVDSLINQLY